MQLAGKLTAALRSFPLNVQRMYTLSSYLEESEEHLEDDRKIKRIPQVDHNHKLSRPIKICEQFQQSLFNSRYECLLQKSRSMATLRSNPLRLSDRNA